MNETSTRGLRSLCAILALVLLVTAAGGGLAVIGLREQAARLADTAQALEHDLAKTTSDLRYMNTAVAQAEEPDVLKARIGATLVPMVERQIVWVRPATSPLRDITAESAPAPAFNLRVASIQPTVLLAQTQ